MKSQIVNVFIVFCLLISGCSLHTDYYAGELREGDLLFQQLDCGGLCDAIEMVTDGVDGKEFSHCAMVVRMGDSLKVIEAIGSNVKISSVASFFARSGDTATITNISVGRLKEEYSSLITEALAFAKLQIGVPYDDEFLIDNKKLYCSELLYESFKAANHQRDFFSLQPMTFRDPVKKTYLPVWIEYYRLLNKPIPEGELGINPGLISCSDKIKIITLDRTTYK